MNILLTGAAGFIASHTAEALLSQGHTVIGLDNLDPFYDLALKQENLEAIKSRATTTGDANSFHFIEGDITNPTCLQKIAQDFQLKTENGPSPWAIVHLAAKAGVRPSIQDPVGYQKANVEGTQVLLEFAREHQIEQFVFASSSSVYGINPKRPWSEDDHDLRPISPYASTKLSCELLGHVYASLYPIRFIGLRFFTVYGPRQRPDLAIRKFITKIDKGESIPVFGDGSTSRDYSFINDIVGGILKALEYKEKRYDIFNLGNDRPISLNQMIQIIEEALGKPAIIDRQGNQPGDVPHTLADMTKTREVLNYNPETPFRKGIEIMVEWYKNHHS